MTSLKDRAKIVIDISIAINDGARAKKVCDVVNISLKTFRRWKKNEQGDLRPTATKISPKALTLNEKKKILEFCNNEEFRDMSPNQIVPILSQRGTYIASESSFYKVLRENKLLKHREKSKKPKKIKKPNCLVANGPLQVLSWDITYLKTSVKGTFFYLYLFMDIWSRKIVGWTVADNESGEIASKTITSVCHDNNIDSINLHSDNGSPMKCGTMLATLEWLGVTPSFSRPRVSNDNAFSESLFKTLKYRPSYPSKFETIEQAKEWVVVFVSWYNTEHHHSGIKFVTPEERHTGLDIKILKKRTETYEKAKLENPKRWAKNIRNWEHQEIVELNTKPEKFKAKKIA